MNPLRTVTVTYIDGMTNDMIRQIRASIDEEAQSLVTGRLKHYLRLHHRVVMSAGLLLIEEGGTIAESSFPKRQRKFAVRYGTVHSHDMRWHTFPK